MKARNGSFNYLSFVLEARMGGGRRGGGGKNVIFVSRRVCVYMCIYICVCACKYRRTTRDNAFIAARMENNARSTNKRGVNNRNTGEFS